MCGISGFINFPKHRVTDRIRSAQMHRGPDDFNTWSSGSFFLAHHRLSIIDLETGAQPMTSEDENYTIVYNGEVYNFRELRKELEHKGLSFRTTSDTEVILNAYRFWGPACLNRFRGMFAFAIYDKQQHQLFLARDHFGIKPLVYHQSSDGFMFASELQALKSLLHKKPEMDYHALDEYLWLQYIPAPRTIYKDIYKLPPAHYMVVGADGQIKHLEKYWNFTFNEQPEQRSEEEWLEVIDHTLRESVKAHLISDVPFGAFLSGGIDSTLVVAYMAELMNQPVKTFNIGFDHPQYDESNYARIAAKKFSTAHYEMTVQGNMLDILPKIVKHYGEPFGDSSAIPTYYVSQHAASNVKMVLSGDGGDEGFAGYLSYMKWQQKQDYSEVSPLKRLLYPLGRALFPYRYFDRSQYTYWIELNRYFHYEDRNRLYAGKLPIAPAFSHSLFKEIFFQSKGDFLQKAQEMDMKTYLPYDILTKVDIASMANSLEVRTPLIDVKVWEMLATIPSFLNYGFYKGTFHGKLLLKKLLAKKLGDDFVFRKKQGFSMPLEDWLKKDQHNLMEKLKESSSINELFDKSAVNDIIDRGYSHQIWLLLFLDEWLNQWDN